MASMAHRIRSSLPHLQKALLRSNSLSTQRSTVRRAILCPSFSTPEFSRNYATATGPKEEKKVKVPLAMYGGTGNYASALYIAAVRTNAVETVETELLELVEASKKSSMFSLFMKDLSVSKNIRVKAINEICSHAKLSDVTKTFLVILAENGRLKYIESIAKRFSELTMAHKGEVKAIVTSVIPLPPEEEKELKETLQEIINKGGQGNKIKLEQKIDPSILGGLVVEFGQKVFDMSIKTRAHQMERFLRDPVNFDSL